MREKRGKCNQRKGVMGLELHIWDDKKLVEIWLNSEEKKDDHLREGLKDVYAQFKAQKYLVAVYESGEGDLYQGTLHFG